MYFSSGDNERFKEERQLRERTVGMPKATFDLQVVTPLFLAGANQREYELEGNDKRPEQPTHAWGIVPELRSSSFRGLMRYWLRTAVAGVKSAQSIGLEQVRDIEKYIFGSTDQGSAVQVRITNIPENIEEFIEKFEKEGGYSQGKISGKNYLYWSMAESGQGDQRKPARRYISQGTKFSITLSEHGQEDIEAHKLEGAIAAFWLLITLGGLGSRSRRCAGSLVAIKTTKSVPNLSFAEARDAQELQRILRQGIQEVRRMYTSQLAVVENSAPKTSPALLGTASFDRLIMPGSCRIWVLQRKDGSSWHSVRDALADIGRELQAGRKGISSLQQRTVFGLPLIVRDMDKSKLKDALEKYRRASPLHLKISRLQGGRYAGVAVLFKTHYDDIENILPEPDYSQIENWIERNLSFVTALEVIL